jgi:hypothetical protein
MPLEFQELDLVRLERLILLARRDELGVLVFKRSNSFLERLDLCGCHSSSRILNGHSTPSVVAG